MDTNTTQKVKAEAKTSFPTLCGPESLSFLFVYYQNEFC